LGIPKCSETHNEMTIGNFTPFGELNLYKRNGVGRQPGDRLPGCLCWQISIVGAKASTWGDTSPPLPCLPFVSYAFSPFCQCLSFPSFSEAAMASSVKYINDNYEVANLCNAFPRRVRQW